nr:DUF4134 family protein [Longitalea luteola]
MCVRNCLKSKRRVVYASAFTVALLLVGASIYAQDGAAGINEANMKVRSYYAAGTNLMYACGAVVGLIGAVKV